MSATKHCSWQALENRQISHEWQTCFDFDADDWYFPEYAPGKEAHVRQIHIHFSDEEGVQTKYLLKQYAAWRLGRVRPVTVRLELNVYLKHWLRYLRVRQINSPGMFGSRELERFGQWLRMQNMKQNTCERILYTVYRLLVTGQRLGWQVTTEHLPQNIKYLGQMQEQMAGSQNEGWITQKLIHQIQPGVTAEQQRELMRAGATPPIPVYVYGQILRHAICDETDEITRAGIIIQSQTGLRISEVLSLRENCIKRDGHGNCWLSYSMKKTARSEPEQRLIPANELVCEAVGRLEMATEALRCETGRNELFLIRNHGIHPVSQTNWNKGRLKNFMRRWAITEEDGREYELRSHQFRATYVRQQLLDGGQIGQIQHRFGHVSPEMTARYVHFSQEDLQNILATCMGKVGR